MMSKYKLHPVTILIGAVKSLREMIIPIVIVVLANGFNFSFDMQDEDFLSNLIPLAILSMVVLFTLIGSVVKWFTFRYWFEDSELRVQYGLFVKKKRFIPFDRIQSLNYKEGIFHRLFGLVQVEVETAGSKDGKPEASLTAIKRAQADRIEAEMNQAKYGIVTTEEDVIILPKQRVVYKMSAKDLIILATTSSGIGVVIFGVVAALSQVADYIPYEWLYEEFAYLVEYSVAVVIALVLFGMLAAWIISIALTLINYYDFKVIEENERLIITRGLLEKKRVTIPLNRVQAIKIVENPFRQPFGLSTVELESAGGGFSEGNDKKIVLFPLIAKKQVIQPLAELFPMFEFSVDNMKKSPKRARPFFYRMDLLWTIPFVVAPAYFWFPYGMLAALLFVPVFLFGIWQHKTAAFKKHPSQLTIVYRLFSRTTFYVQKHRIQAMEQSQSYFQRRKDIASVEVTVMSGMNGAEASAFYMERADAEEIMAWYEHKKQHHETEHSN